FMAAPHGVSMGLVPRIMDCMPGSGIIDLSGDFRLKDTGVYRQYYKKEHQAPWLVEKFVYGLSEFNRNAVAQARYVANPGCFATGIIFALYPLYTAEAVRRDVTVTAVTGSSGSGELPKEVTHHPVRAKNFKSYKILQHQHTPEIEQFFRNRSTDQKVEIGFIPQSGPFVRGIYTTAVVYNGELDLDKVKEAYLSAYENERFVRIVDGSPEVAAVYGTNYVELSWSGRHGFVVSMSAIDNLVRGASGQAVQNMNIMFGFEETLGLEFPGMRP
ncbi:MAG: N-acetyl-gamma-glutamyl-phosphate reductase, partial [Spirochaetota bacterium]